MVSGASITVDRSPFMVRTSFTLGQSSSILGEWAARNGSRKVVTLVNDWAPGIEAETAFKQRFTQAGGEIIESLRIPLANPDFSPFLQRVRDAAPDTAFIYFPGTQAGIFAKQFVERGLDKSGIRIIGPGDLTDDDELNGLGDQMLGMVTAHHYSAAHDSAMTRLTSRRSRGRTVFGPISSPSRLRCHACHLRGAEKDWRSTDGEALVAAMKGMTWESPRGTISIDSQTRDIVQNIYIRKVEKVGGELYNIELQTFDAVRDPMKAATK